MIQFEAINIQGEAQEAIYISVKEVTSVESSENHTGDKTTKEVEKYPEVHGMQEDCGKKLETESRYGDKIILCNFHMFP